MTYEDLKPHILKCQALNAALTLFSWDQDTEAPSQSVDNTTKFVGVLTNDYFEAVTNPEAKKILMALSKQELPLPQKAVVKKWLKDIKQLEKIPVDEYQAHQELLMKAQRVWQQAKITNDYPLFKPYLKKIVEDQKRFAKYRQENEECLYDVLLEDFEPGFTTKELDEFFTLLRKEIVPLLKRIQESPKQIDKSFMNREYPIDIQRTFNLELAKYIGFDFERGVIKESEHPFTTNFHNHDVRLTTHYYLNNLESAIFSTIHETGHATYEFNIADEITLTPANQVSMGRHESQSRFYENIIGRSQNFWKPLYPKLKALFPKQLEDITFDHFIEAINKVEASLIRTEADELTYSLHIMIRYEIEKKLFSEEVDYDTLPELWNQMYQDYLGMTPPNDTLGILQDVHWAGGMLGYFPSYALGSAIASQIYDYMQKNTDIDKWIQVGDFEAIKGYLREHIHQYGAIYDTNELLVMMTNEKFNAHYYVDYLKKKFITLYQLKDCQN